MAIRVKLSIALFSVGALITLCGGALALIGWKAQHDAQVLWEQAPAENPLPVREAKVSAREEFKPRQRISFPTLDRRFIVFQGATTENLLMGPARLSSSGLPGKPGNVVIAAHRDTHFRLLKDVRRGDPIDIDYAGQTFRYQVVALKIVDAEDDFFYEPTDTPVLTLVTCYPFNYLGAAPERYIVRAALMSSAL